MYVLTIFIFFFNSVDQIICPILKLGCLSFDYQFVKLLYVYSRWKSFIRNMKQIFSNSLLACLFIFLKVTFEIQRCSIFIESICWSFLLYFVLLYIWEIFIYSTCEDIFLFCCQNFIIFIFIFQFILHLEFSFAFGVR